MQAAEDQLSFVTSELEKQKILNEQLESDLLAVEKHKPNGDIPTPAESRTDLLAGLEIGKKSHVSVSVSMIYSPY